MNKAFEKIIERLEELHERYVNQYGVVGGNPVAFAVKECKDIVQEVAEEFATDTNVGTNGWIPCSERLPEEDGFYLATLDGEIAGEEKPFSGLAEFENGKWVDDDEDYQCIIAWQPIPEPYKERD